MYIRMVLAVALVAASFVAHARNIDDLLKAAESGNAAEVQACLDQGVPVDSQGMFSTTALMVASQQGHLDVVQTLLAKEADVNAKVTYQGLQIANGVAVNNFVGGETALMLAILAPVKTNLEVVRALLAKGADVNAKTSDGMTALMLAAEYEGIDVVQALLAKGADVNAKASGGTTALMFASKQGHLEVVQTLLAKGADVNAKRKESGWTSLMAAAGNGHLEVVQALLAKKADVNAKANDGTTALMLAFKQGHAEIGDLLVKAGGHAK
jgi:ankyrin repeat protein